MCQCNTMSLEASLGGRDQKPSDNGTTSTNAPEPSDWSRTGEEDRETERSETTMGFEEDGLQKNKTNIGSGVTEDESVVHTRHKRDPRTSGDTMNECLSTKRTETEVKSDVMKQRTPSATEDRGGAPNQPDPEKGIFIDDVSDDDEEEPEDPFSGAPDELLATEIYYEHLEGSLSSPSVHGTAPSSNSPAFCGTTSSFSSSKFVLSRSGEGQQHHSQLGSSYKIRYSSCARVVVVRAWTDNLCLSSGFYLLAALLSLSCGQHTSAVLQCLASCASTAFHRHSEARFFALDFCFSSLLALKALYLAHCAFASGDLLSLSVLGLHGAVCAFLFVYCDFPGHPRYDFYHLLWHLASASATAWASLCAASHIPHFDAHLQDTLAEAAAVVGLGLGLEFGAATEEQIQVAAQGLATQMLG